VEVIFKIKKGWGKGKKQAFEFPWKLCVYVKYSSCTANSLLDDLSPEQDRLFWVQV